MQNSSQVVYNTTLEIDSLAIRVLEVTILSVICVLASFGNISLWVVILKTRDLRKESNYLILCLSSADILVSLGMPITCLSIFYGHWLLTDVVCQVLGFLNMVSFIASVTSLGVISFNRYVKICKPNKYNLIYSRVNIFLMIAGVWVLSSILALPPLIGWGMYAYLPDQSFCFCDWTTSISYTFFMVGMCFGGPCIVMTISYVCILRTIRASSRKVFSMAPAEHSASRHRESDEITIDENSKTAIYPSQDLPVNNVESNNQIISNDNQTALPPDLTVPKRKVPNLKFVNQKEKRRQEEIRITSLFLVVIFAFVISWLPFCISMFLSVFLTSYSARHFDMFTLLLGYANSCYNPFIYGFMNYRVKRGYKTVFSSIFKCKK